MALAEKCSRGGIEQVNYSSRKIGGYLMAVFMLLAIASIASTTAQAQYPGSYGQDRYRNDRYRNDRNGYYNAYQIAREQGYRNGLSTGASDAQRGQSYNPQRSHF